MRYVLDATEVVVDLQSLFIGFTNNDENRYFFLQRSDDHTPTPGKQNIWLERDDKSRGGCGGLGRAILSRGQMILELLPEYSSHLEGVDAVDVTFAVSDAEYDGLCATLDRMMDGYESDLSIERPTTIVPTVDLVTIESYANAQEATLAKSALQDAGISSYLMGQETVTAIWHVGSALGGVKLQVAQSDVQRAKVILDQAHSTGNSGSTAAWTCPKCRSEVDAGFAVCWSCGFAPEEIAALQVPGEQHEAAPVDEAVHSAEQVSRTNTETGDEFARRAWRAAIFGIGFPPLIPYSLYLISKAYQHPLSPGAEFKTYGAMAIAAVMFCWFWMFCILT